MELLLERYEAFTDKNYFVLNTERKTAGCLFMIMLRLTSVSPRKFLASKSVLVFNYSPYFHQIWHHDYFLFLKLKMKLKRKQFIILNIILNI